MLLTDLIAITQWWFTLFLIGIGFFPLTSYFFSEFSDKGYTFAKIFGIAGLSYLVFVVGMLHILPFTLLFTGVLLLGVATILYGFLWRQVLLPLFQEKTFFRVLLPLIVFEEVCFLIGLLAWAFVRAHNPDIIGLEKYMDFGFVNTILKSEFFPPKDMWFTPLSINYYYFGHFMTAVITKLSGIPSFITYNLMIATLFSLSFVASFSIGVQLCRSVMKKNALVMSSIAGLLTAIFVTLSGNLHILYGFFSGYNAEDVVPLWQLPFVPAAFPNSYWYPQATRFVYNTIHEFPLYSWVVADLHGHVTDIPFVLLTIATLFAFFSGATKGLSLRKYFCFLLLLGFIHAVMYMTNAWDGAIYLLLTMLVVLFIIWRISKDTLLPSPSILLITQFLSQSHKKLAHVLLQKHSFFAISSGFCATMFFIVITYLVSSLPFNLFFKPFVSGIGILCAPQFLIKLQRIGPFLFEADHCQRTPFWQLLILYGFFFFFTYSFLFFIVLKKKISYTDIFVTMLIFIATLLIIIPEFIYVKDIYPAHYRANTMFKLVFQSFIMLSITSIYIFIRLVTNDGFTKITTRRIYGTILYTTITLILMSTVLIYPPLAINSYYGEFKTYKGLNGIQYLEDKYPDDFAVITWMSEHIPGQPVVLEAHGDGYTEYGRVSVHTGLPTVLGWLVHEWLWRGDYNIPAPRVTDVETMYKTKDIATTKKLLDKYDVSYVFVGDLERDKYPGFPEEKFAKLGTLIYQNGNTKLYKLQ